MLIITDTIVIPKGLNVYSNQSGSFADAEGIACIDGKMGNWQKSALVGIAVLKKIFANSDLAINSGSDKIAHHPQKRAISNT